MDRISRRSQGLEGVRFGDHRISSLIFADDVVLLAPSSLDLQHALGRFAAECEAAGMRVSTSKSEAMVLDRKKVACTLQVGGELLPQVEEFKYLGVLFTSEGRMDHEIDRQIGAVAAVMRSMYLSVVVKKELSRKAKLSINQSIYVPTLTYGHELWVMTKKLAGFVELDRAIMVFGAALSSSLNGRSSLYKAVEKGSKAQAQLNDVQQHGLVGFHSRVFIGGNGPGFQQHLQRQKMVLGRLQDAGLKATEESPFCFIFGQEPRLPIDFLLGRVQGPVPDHHLLMLPYPLHRYTLQPVSPEERQHHLLHQLCFYFGQRRWKEYFEELMNEENEREKRVEGVNSVEQKVDKIRKDEVRKALKRMKSGKAVGPDDIPVEVWKCLGEAAVEFLANLFNRVLENLEKAYDRVPREELWYCMRKSGVAEKYVRVVQDMYERSRTVVRCAVGQTEEFNVEVGLHQGSALSPFLFAMVMDQLSEEVRQESPWTMMFADDIVICSESREQVEENLDRWRFALERRGMKVSRSKTEYMCVNEREGSGTVRLQGEEVKKVQEFKYLGSTVQSNGECGKEVKKRVQAGWNGWRKVSGVLCDQKISARIKGKVYRTVVRAAMLYGLETVSLRKRQESELEVAELKMLRFSLGVTRLDRIRNEYIRGTAHVGRLGDKVREARLRWFGHVQRRESEYIGRRMFGHGAARQEAKRKAKEEYKRHLSTTSNSQTPNSTMAKTKELSKDTRNKIVDLHQAGKTESAIDLLCPLPSNSTFMYEMRSEYEDQSELMFIMETMWPRGEMMTHQEFTTAFFGVYIPPSANAKEALCELYGAISELQNAHPDRLFIIAGDFNHVNLKSLLPKFHQHVDFATRGTNTLDLIYTNFPGAYRAEPRPHLGYSEHISVMLIPVYRPLVRRSKPVLKQVKTWPAGAISALQDCFECTDWNMFREAATNGESINLEEYTTSVTSYISKCIDDVTVSKTITTRSNQKPWMTAEVGALLKS
ncbi:hypothetical protein QTP70_009253 [Hemibagrus guttatus]|uniref:ribonuclease H n=1 Tax=Hemibagrus guttatus TaxID=175788 RepID=A0AAE0QKB6_9TELE|nr:hypothetical protein QTP70_009253 [Hemibagrus guttatus]